MKTNFLKIIYWLPIAFIFLFIFIFPLIFSFFIYTHNVFELIKAAVLWPAALILLLLTLIKSLVFSINIKEYINYKLFIIIFLLALFLILNTYFIAEDTNLAIFGDYNRRQGLFSQLSYLLFFILIIFNLLIIKNFKKVFNSILLSFSLSGFLVALYGFLQYIGLDYFTWQETVIASRVISSIGQPNFLASFLLLSLGASFTCFFRFKIFYYKLFFLANIFLHFLTIYLSSSRSAIISLALVFIFSIFIFIKKRKSKIIFLLSFIISAFIFSILLFDFLPSSRLSLTFDINQGSSLARVEFYKTSLNIIKDKPLLGYGMEQAGNQFVTYYNPDWALFSKVNDYPDRVHNIILDLIINFGILGFIVYFSIFLYLFYFLLFKNKVKEKNIYFIYLAILAYIFSLFFSFPSLATSLYFWGLLALLFSLALKDSLIIKESLFKYKNRKIILIIIIILNIFLLNFAINNSLRSVKADHQFFICYNSLVNYNLDNLEHCFRALDLTSDPVQRDYYHIFIVNYYIDRYYNFDENWQKIFDDYLFNLYDKIDDNNYELLFTKAKIACYLKKDNFQEVFKTLINYSPKRPAVYYYQANCYNYLANYEEAIDAYKMALSLLPDIYDFRLNNEHQASLKSYKHLLCFGLGQSYALIGNYEKAILYFKQAYYNNPEFINIFKNIAQAYYLLENYEKAINAYKMAWEKDQKNDYWPLMIYQLYDHIGDNENAQKYFKKLNN